MPYQDITSSLLYISIAALPIYFYSFAKLIGTLEPEQKQRFTKEGRLPGWRRFLAVIPIFLTILIPNTEFRILLILWTTIQLILDTRAHHKKLVIAQFEESFIRRLSRISIFGGIITLGILMGTLLRSIDG